MKYRLLPLLLLAVGVGAGWYVLSHTPREGKGTQQLDAPEAVPGSPPGRSVATPDALLAGEPVARPENPLTNGVSSPPEAAVSAKAVLASVPAGLTPDAVLGQMRITIHLYASMLGENPVGSNSEITRSLNGGNARHVKFIRPEAGMRINERGELVDSWATPFFFHQLSASHMEIRSAGPDRVMWTADDLVVR